MLWRLKEVHTAVRLPAIPCLCMAETTSSSVKSGCFSISVSSHCACASNGDLRPPRGLAAQLPVSCKYFTHLTAALGLMSSCSAASRREDPPSTRAITRMRMSAEYAFGMARPPDESMPPDSPIYRSLGILRFYSARTCSRSIADQAAGCRNSPPSVNCGRRMAGGHLHELLAPAIEERVVADDERADVQLHEGCKSGIDLAFGARLHDMHLDPLCACRLLRLSHHLVGTRIVGVHEQGDLPGLGNKFGQQFEPLGIQRGQQHARAREVAARSSETGDEA